MSVKKLIFILCCALPLFSFAKERQIEVRHGSWHGDTRSILSAPIVSYDGNILYIYSYLPLENLEVKIKDILGNVVYEQKVSIVAGEKFSLYIELIENSELYVVELISNKQSFYGYF